MLKFYDVFSSNISSFPPKTICLVHIIFHLIKMSCHNFPDWYNYSTFLGLQSVYFYLLPFAAAAAAAAAALLQLCLTLCDPIDGSPPGSPVPGILQARTLEWVAISFSNAWKRKVKVKSLSHVWLLATPSTAAYQAPLSMGFSRQEYQSGLPLPSPTRVW